MEANDILISEPSYKGEFSVKSFAHELAKFQPSIYDDTFGDMERFDSSQGGYFLLVGLPLAT